MRGGLVSFGGIVVQVELVSGKALSRGGLSHNGNILEKGIRVVWLNERCFHA